MHAGSRITLVLAAVNATRGLLRGVLRVLVSGIECESKARGLQLRDARREEALQTVQIGRHPLSFLEDPALDFRRSVRRHAVEQGQLILQDRDAISGAQLDRARQLLRLGAAARRQKSQCGGSCV